MRVDYIVKDADDPKWAAAKAAGHEVHGQLITVRTPQGLDADGLAESFRRYEGTRSGPCVVLAMGPSRSRLPRGVRLPVYAVNRAILDYPEANIWCAHDIDSVLDCHKDVPLSVPLATYSCNWLKPGFDKVQASGRKLIAWDIFTDPSRHSRKPLYWNLTTVGPVLDWVVRMGHKPVFTIGTDCTQGGYVNPHYSERELMISHELVRKKLCFMFTPEERAKWDPANTPILDLSGGQAPWEHVGMEALSAYV